MTAKDAAKVVEVDCWACGAFGRDEATLALGERTRIAREVVEERLNFLRRGDALHSEFTRLLGQLTVSAEWKAADILLFTLFGPAKEATE